MDFEAFIYILKGSTIGIFLRILIKFYLNKKRVFYLDSTSFINILASLFLGTFVALNPSNKNLFFFFYVGFLGCFSTFSSFIYQLFDLIKNGKYLLLFFYYIQVLALSFLFFSLGNFIIFIFKI